MVITRLLSLSCVQLGARCFLTFRWIVTISKTNFFSITLQKPQATQSSINPSIIHQWPQIIRSHLKFVQVTPQRLRDLQVPIIAPINSLLFEGTSVSMVAHPRPLMLLNPLTPAMPPQWYHVLQNPRQPIIMPQSLQMSRYFPATVTAPHMHAPDAPVRKATFRMSRVLRNHQTPVVMPWRPPILWQPRVPPIMLQRPQMPIYPPRPTLEAPARPPHLRRTPNRPRYSPPQPQFPKRNTFQNQIYPAVPQITKSLFQKPVRHQHLSSAPVNSVSSNSVSFPQQSFYYNSLLDKPALHSSAQIYSRSRSHTSLIYRPLVKKLAAQPVLAHPSGAYISASVAGYTRPKINIAPLNDEMLGEAPITDVLEQEYNNNEQQKHLKNMTVRKPRPAIVQKRTSFITAENCEGSMSCRSLHHCALLGGQATQVACGPFPTFHCCEIHTSTELVHNTSTRIMSDPECGRNREKTSRIVGGHNAEFGEHPWQAFIRVGEARCGGALVSRRHVVTAAHCINGKTINMVEVLLGELILGSVVEELPHERRGVIHMAAHPSYKDLNIDSHDVAVLVLDRPVRYQSNIQPICLPEPDENVTGAMATVSGWGRVFPDQEMKANHLQAVQVPVIDNLLCRRWLRRRNKYAGVFADHVCAGYEQGGNDSCRGDSGGPLVYKKNERWYLIGLVSAGYSCSKPMQPGIYHRISSSSEWISRYVFGKNALKQTNDAHAAL